MEKKEVPIWEKANLTIDEAAAYLGLGQINCAILPVTLTVSLLFGSGRRG